MIIFGNLSKYMSSCTRHRNNSKVWYEGVSIFVCWFTNLINDIIVLYLDKNHTYYRSYFVVIILIVLVNHGMQNEYVSI